MSTRLLLLFAAIAVSAAGCFVDDSTARERPVGSATSVQASYVGASSARVARITAVHTVASVPRVSEATTLAHSLVTHHKLGVGATTAAAGARWRLGNNGLPRNTRQVPEGYWVGSQPAAQHIEELHGRGVRVIVSGTRMHLQERKKCEELGIQRVNVPFGGRFPNRLEIETGVAEVSPSQVFIHCAHGGDRSGAMLAYLLVSRHGWSPDRALLAVAFPAVMDLRRLRQMLDERGFNITDEKMEKYAGLYSGERNGGFGGLKVRGPSYEKLVRTTLAAMFEYERTAELASAH